MHAPGRNSVNERLARRTGRYLHTTQQRQDTNIHAIIVIRTRDPSNKAAADLRLRPLSDQDRPSLFKFRL